MIISNLKLFGYKLSSNPLTATPMMSPIVRNMFLIDITDPLNLGTCSRDKLPVALSAIASVEAQIVQHATETNTFDKSENITANTPATKAVVKERDFRPIRLTNAPPTTAPNAPPTAAIVE
jgi:hypothetical protein